MKRSVDTLERDRENRQDRPPKNVDADENGIDGARRCGTALGQRTSILRGYICARSPRNNHCNGEINE